MLGAGPSTNKYMSSWIYENTPDNSHRFILGETGKKMLACLGLNPSTAEPEKLDRTLESVRRIAKHNKFDGWLMWNISSQRTTDPEALSYTPDYDMHAQNLAHILQSVSDHSIKTVWLAFGNNILNRDYMPVLLEDILTVLRPFDLKHKMISMTQKGFPRHPLYVPGDSKLVNLRGFNV